MPIIRNFSRSVSSIVGSPLHNLVDYDAAGSGTQASTTSGLGIEVNDALDIAVQTEVYPWGVVSGRVGDRPTTAFHPGQMATRKRPLTTSATL